MFNKKHYAACANFFVTTLKVQLNTLCTFVHFDP